MAFLLLALLVVLVGIAVALLMLPPRAEVPGIAADGSPSIGPSAAPGLATPQPSGPPGPATTPIGTPLATLGATTDPAPETPSTPWRRIGRIGNDDMSIMSVVGFAGGFVAVGDRGLEGAAFAFSSDGRDWRVGPLAETIEDCAGNPTNDAYVTGATTDGQRVLVLGKRLEYTADACANPDSGVGAGAISWLSSDGRSWSRSSDFAHAHGIASHAWPIPGGGWEASVDSWDRPSAVWQSTDGLSWNEIATLPEQVGSTSRGAADDAGTRLLETQPDRGPVGLLTSGDGINWSSLSAGPTLRDSAWITAVLAPSGSGMPWLVATADHPDGASIWTSADLGAWVEHDFPGRRVVTGIAAISDGYVATAERLDLYELVCDGGTCPRGAQRQYLSPDGAEWTEVGSRLRYGALFAQGPGGVIAVARYDGRVFLVER